MKPPVYLPEKFKEMPEINQYCLRNASCKNLQVPKAKTELYKKSFIYSGSILWNNLPISLKKSTSSTSSVKKDLKNYLMEH